jgi:hypothetical protein
MNKSGLLSAAVEVQRKERGRKGRIHYKEYKIFVFRSNAAVKIQTWLRVFLGKFRALRQKVWLHQTRAQLTIACKVRCIQAKELVRKKRRLFHVNRLMFMIRKWLVRCVCVPLLFCLLLFFFLLLAFYMSF